jgi:hypothetical protein
MLCSEGWFIYIFHPWSAVFILENQHQHHHHPHPQPALVSCFLTRLLQQTLDLISTRPGLSVDKKPNTVILKQPITIPLGVPKTPLGRNIRETYTDISPVLVLPFRQHIPKGALTRRSTLLSLESVRPQTFASSTSAILPSNIPPITRTCHTCAARTSYTSRTQLNLHICKIRGKTTDHLARHTFLAQ